MQATRSGSLRTPCEPSPGPTPAELRLQRNLKIVVIVLAVLIFAGLATIVGRVIYLASGAPTQPAAPAGGDAGRGQKLGPARGRRRYGLDVAVGR